MRSRGKRTSSLSLHPKSCTHSLDYARCGLSYSVSWNVYRISLGSWTFLIIWRKPQTLCRNMHTYADVRTQSYCFLRYGRLTASSTVSSLISSLLQDGSEGVPCEPMGAGTCSDCRDHCWCFVQIPYFCFIALCPFMSVTAALACFSLEDCQPRKPPDPLVQSWKYLGASLASDKETEWWKLSPLPQVETYSEVWLILYTLLEGSSCHGLQQGFA